MIKQGDSEDKWLMYIEQPKKPKTRVFRIISKCSDDFLGEIKWYPQWRHYCFFPTIELQVVHSDRCLLAISEFIKELNKEHKEKGSHN